MVDPSAAPDPPPGFPNPPRDRLEFWVRIIFGAFRCLFQRVVMGSLFLRSAIWLADGSDQWPHLRTRGRTLWGQSLGVAAELQMATMVVRREFTA
jgi:hypothetical protein